MLYRCSKCGRVITSNSYNHCPYCGVKLQYVTQAVPVSAPAPAIKPVRELTPEEKKNEKIANIFSCICYGNIALIAFLLVLFPFIGCLVREYTINLSLADTIQGLYIWPLCILPSFGLAAGIISVSKKSRSVLTTLGIVFNSILVFVDLIILLVFLCSL